MRCALIGRPPPYLRIAKSTDCELVFTGTGYASAPNDLVARRAVDIAGGDATDAVLSFSIENPVPPIARQAWHARGLGDFWAHMLVAEGAVDGAVDAVGVSEWDLAAVQVIVEEAGGRFSDAAGAPRIDSGTAVTSNGLLHEELLAAVAATRR